VESSCEFGIEPLDSINCWETIECPKQLEISRVVLSSMELVISLLLSSLSSVGDLKQSPRIKFAC
jgi:hypothetical protein